MLGVKNMYIIYRGASTEKNIYRGALVQKSLRTPGVGDRDDQLLLSSTLLLPFNEWTE